MARHDRRPGPRRRYSDPPVGDRPAGWRPTPKPIPIDLDPAPARRMRKKKSAGRRLRHRIRRAAASARVRWTLIGLACLAVVLIGLLAAGFLSSPAAAPPTGPRETPTVAAAGSTAAPSTSPVGTASRPKASATPTTPGDQAVQQTLRNSFPDNPLNHLQGAGTHQVVIEVRSSESIPLVGWLEPTGLSNTYGTKHNTGNFTLSQQALGKGYLAAVFVQAGADGSPVTCRVIVDGKVTNTAKTSGGYGRTICLG